MSSNLSVVVLTFNEELNLAQCLQSVVALHCPLYVVDSGSTDATVAIANQFNASVVTHRFESHAKQWKWAFSELPLATEWVLAIDADQYLNKDLATEITDRFSPASLDSIPPDVAGIYLNRRYIFRGRWLRHGGLYPKPLLKLFRLRAVELDEHDMLDHHFYVRGRTIQLLNDLVEHNRKEDDIGFWSKKHIGYATSLATEEVLRRREGLSRLADGKLMGTPDERIVALKSVWSRMPPYFRPFLYFFYRYVIRLGWLDGKQGLIFHTLQALWFRLLVDITVDELLDRRAGEDRTAVNDRAIAEQHNE